MGVQYLSYARGLFRPKRLESLFLFVTSTCNSLCRTCFYWEELNQGRDLTFAQFATLSRTAPTFHKLWISGGEPFLRKDLAEIIELFYINNGVRHVNLPTNGLLPEKLDAVISRVLARCPELVIDLNFSLDGPANTHDAIRGVPNNFEKTLATIQMTSRKWKQVRRPRCCLPLNRGPFNRRGKRDYFQGGCGHDRPAPGGANHRIRRSRMKISARAVIGRWPCSAQPKLSGDSF